MHLVSSYLTFLFVSPQDPVLFSATLRSNLDPFNDHTDAAVWEALDLAHLKSFTEYAPHGLSYEVGENGEALR